MWVLPKLLSFDAFWNFECFLHSFTEGEQKAWLNQSGFHILDTSQFSLAFCIFLWFGRCTDFTDPNHFTNWGRSEPQTGSWFCVTAQTRNLLEPSFLYCMPIPRSCIYPQLKTVKVGLASWVISCLGWGDFMDVYNSCFLWLESLQRYRKLNLNSVCSWTSNAFTSILKVSNIW